MNHHDDTPSRAAHDDVCRALHATIVERDRLAKENVRLKAGHREQLLAFARAYIEHRPARQVANRTMPESWGVWVPVKCDDNPDRLSVRHIRHFTEAEAIAAVLKGAGVEMEEPA